MRSRCCASCPSSSAACSGRSHGSGRTRGPRCTAPCTEPKDTTTTSSRWARRRAPARSVPRSWITCASSSTPWPTKGSCRPRCGVYASTSMSAPTRRRVRRALRKLQRKPDGSTTPRHLCVLRLADLLQVQAAAVEHGVAGDRDHAADRGPHGDDPRAERGGSVERRRARDQVHYQHPAAVPGSRNRHPPALQQTQEYVTSTLP